MGSPSASTLQYCVASTSTSCANSSADFERHPDRDLAVVRHQAGVTVEQALGDVARQLLGAEGVVGYERDVAAAGHRHHVVERRDRLARAREHGRVERMRVHDRVHVGAGAVGGEMEAPLARGLLRFLVGHLALGVDEDDVARADLVVGHAGRRDQHAGLPAAGDVAGAAGRKPRAAHGERGLDDRAARVPLLQFCALGFRPHDAPHSSSKERL